MWPADAFSTRFSLLECIWKSLPSRSFLPLVALMTWAPDSTCPVDPDVGQLAEEGCGDNARPENGSSPTACADDLVFLARA